MTRIIDLAGVEIDRKMLMQISGFFSNHEGTCLLYSGQNDSYQSSRSFLCLWPYEFISIEEKTVWQRKIGQTKKVSISTCENPWDALKAILTSSGEEHEFPHWIGFFGYEMGAFSDRKKTLPYQRAKTADAYFQKCALVIAVDHETNKVQVVVSEESIPFFEESVRQWIQKLSDPECWPQLIQFFAENRTDVSSRVDLAVYPQDTLDSYCAKVQQAKEWIKSGDIYQLNLSQQFILQGRANPFNIFEDLAAVNPAPFSAYFKLKNYSIVSSSPESFLKKKQGILETRPIKGTAPRGKTSEEDRQNKARLLTSEKEKAELLMITDLMRNDLGKFSIPGSVHTEEIWGCETYANVFHMVSTIRSKPVSEVHNIDMIRDCFPGGSITGCPKMRAMELIHQLENRPRGIYTGSIGYFAGNGNFDFNIAIRTITVHEDWIDLQLGGAIVADSDPQNEFAETFHKGASIFQVVAPSYTK